MDDINPTDIKGRRNLIRGCIADGSTQKALHLLLDYIRDFCSDDSAFMDRCILISSRWSYITSENGQGNNTSVDEILKVNSEILVLCRIVYNSIIE